MIVCNSGFCVLANSLDNKNFGFKNVIEKQLNEELKEENSIDDEQKNEELELTYNTNVSLTSPTKTGYYFDGWCIDNNQNNLQNVQNVL